MPVTLSYGLNMAVDTACRATDDFAQFSKTLFANRVNFSNNGSAGRAYFLCCVVFLVIN
jgi:hypothetical protein